METTDNPCSKTKKSILVTNINNPPNTIIKPKICVL